MVNINPQIDKVIEQVREFSQDELTQLMAQLEQIMQQKTEENISAPIEPLSNEEVRMWMTPEPMSGKEIVAAGLLGAWAHKEIDDPVAWLKQERKRHDDERQWQRDS